MNKEIVRRLNAAPATVCRFQKGQFYRARNGSIFEITEIVWEHGGYLKGRCVATPDNKRPSATMHIAWDIDGRYGRTPMHVLTLDCVPVSLDELYRALQSSVCA